MAGISGGFVCVKQTKDRDEIGVWESINLAALTYPNVRLHLLLLVSE